MNDSGYSMDELYQAELDRFPKILQFKGFWKVTAIIAPILFVLLYSAIIVATQGFIGLKMHILFLLIILVVSYIGITGLLARGWYFNLMIGAVIMVGAIIFSGSPPLYIFLFLVLWYAGIFATHMISYRRATDRYRTLAEYERETVKREYDRAVYNREALEQAKIEDEVAKSHGTEKTVFCPTCGFSLLPGEDFCPRCNPDAARSEQVAPSTFAQNAEVSPFKPFKPVE